MRVKNGDEEMERVIRTSKAGEDCLKKITFLLSPRKIFSHVPLCKLLRYLASRFRKASVDCMCVTSIRRSGHRASTKG